MKDATTVIDNIMQTGLLDRYKLVHIPFQEENGWHSAIAHVQNRYNQNEPVALLKVQQYKRLNPREAFGLHIMSHYPGTIKIPQLIEEGEVFTIQELCPGTMLDNTKHAVPVGYAVELGKLLAWQMFPPADIQVLLKQKMAVSEFNYYPNVPPPKRIIAAGAQKNVNNQMTGDVFSDENEMDEFVKILSTPYLGFEKGDWRLSNTLFNATVTSEVFYSVDYGFSFIVSKNEPNLFEKRVAVFDLMLVSLGEVFAKKMIDSFVMESKFLLSR